MPDAAVATHWSWQSLVKSLFEFELSPIKGYGREFDTAKTARAAR